MCVNCLAQYVELIALCCVQLFIMQWLLFLRATAVPAGTAVVRISYENSVCLSVRLSVCHDPVRIQGQVR